MAKQKNSQAEFKRFEQLFNQVHRQNSENRRGAKGTLTPELMRKHLASGAPMDLLHGVNRQGKAFTRDDLVKFGKATKDAKQKYGFNKRGVPVKQLIASSLTADIMRAKQQIRTATLYRLFNSKDGMILHFRVTASKNSRLQHHQVKIRLDEWSNWITSTKSYKTIVNKILSGRISFECDCGRHQYWYRYIATVGGFAIKPLEYAYPKIRNPRLTGCCCKHVLKAFSVLQGPVVSRMVEKEVEKQAKAIGFGDDKAGAGRFLQKDELDKLEKESRQAKDVDKSMATKAFGMFQRAKQGIKQKMSETSVMKSLNQMRSERAAYKKIATQEKRSREKAERENQQMSKDLLKANLNTALLQAAYRDNVPREKAIEKFAKANDISVRDANKLAEDIAG
jgi:hypothetical protein